MWYKIPLSVIIIILAVAIQVAYLSSFGTYWGSFNIVLAGLVFLLYFLDFRWILFFAITSGFLLDIYSSLPFGIFLISLFATVFVLEMLLSSFFTNRSLYSVLSLGGVAVVFFNVMFLIISGLTYLLGVNNFYISAGYFIGLVYQVVNVLIVLAVLFFLANSFSRKFKPNFIRS
jgi:hypothetical protein